MIAPDVITAAKSAIPLPVLIGATVELKRQGRDWVGLCPFHNERTPSFYVWEEHYHCFGCGAHGDAIQFVRQFERLNFNEAVAHLSAQTALQGTPSPVRRNRAKRNTFPAAMRCWEESSAPGDIVSTYLRSRGGLLVPEDAPIRFHPRCQRGSWDTPGGPDYWPAMLTLMTDAVTGKSVGVHRTFLLPDGSGKAPTVEREHVTLRSKSILGNWGVVRLVPDQAVGEGLGIAEGIETALAVMQLIGWGPVWAAGPASILQQFPVLEGHALTIFADGDEPGVEAARVCAKRWVTSGAEVITHVPPRDTDWLDVFMRRAR